MKKIKLLAAILASTLLFGTVANAAEFTVTDTAAVLYSNANAVLYSDADTASTVILPAEAFPDGIQIGVTGITSNGFFRVNVGVVGYVPADGLQVTADAVAATPAANPADKYAGYTPTMGDKQALKKAKSYLNTSAFSHDGLIHQLEYSKFSTAEATYAADMCGADWNQQALKKAQSYLNTSAFSYEGLIHQLEYSKFTTAQAKYGADNCGANWYEQAAKKAESYLRTSAFSRDGLIHQLEYSKFSHDQAVYGATAVGY